MNQKKVSRADLATYLANVLDITRFRDYCPNGLQVEGKEIIGTLVSGVTASMALIEAAITHHADAILVHHGYFWRGEDARVVGQRQRRLKALLAHDMNLFAYHLPLDAHPEWGNNAQLAHVLGLQPEGHFGDDALGWTGTVKEASIGTAKDLACHVEKCLGRRPLLIGEAQQTVGKIAWCSGAAQGFLEAAIAAGATIYMSGEISEPTVHLAREAGVAYLACGHHATERYGVAALGEHIANRFGITHIFVDIDNPV